MIQKENFQENKQEKKMVIFINTVVFFIYLIAVIWSWKSLTNLSPLKKIIVILAGILIVYIITSILLNISKTNITYPTEEMGQKVTTVLQQYLQQ